MAASSVQAEAGLAGQARRQAALAGDLAEQQDAVGVVGRDVAVGRRAQRRGLARPGARHRG